MPLQIIFQKFRKGSKSLSNKIRIIQLAIILSALFAATSIFADVKIKTRTSSEGRATGEMTTFIKGKRQRPEMGEQLVMITQCDLRRSVQLVPQSKTYLVNLFGDTNAAQTGITKTNEKVETTVVRGGTVTTVYTVRDTGERKQMFGYTARHIIMTIETQPTPDAIRCQGTPRCPCR